MQGLGSQHRSGGKVIPGLGRKETADQFLWFAENGSGQGRDTESSRKGIS